MMFSTDGRLGRSLATSLLTVFLLVACAAPGGSAPPALPDRGPTSDTAMAAQAAASEPDVAEIVIAPTPVDPLRPEVRLDLDDRAAQTDLWERVRRGFAMPDLDTALVRNREQWYATRPD